MLNISKISKMLLVSGLVLAFSCVTLDANVAFADECNKAKRDLEDVKKETEKMINQASEQLKEAENAMNSAKSKCPKDQSLNYCTDYQSKKNTWEGYKGAYEKTLETAEENINIATATASKACKMDYNPDEDGGNKDEYNRSRKDEKVDKELNEKDQAKHEAGKERNDAEAAKNEAERAKNDAQKAYNEQQNKTEEAEKAMQEACSKDPSSPACVDARNKFNEEYWKLENEQNKYNDAKSKYNEANQKYRDAEEKYKAAEEEYNEVESKKNERYQDKLNDAQKDIDKYCALGERSYNEKKCKEAKDTKAAAESELGIKNEEKKDVAGNTYSANDDEELKKEFEATQNAVNNDPTKIADVYVSDSEINRLEEKTKKAEADLNSAGEKVSELEQQMNIACSKPKSKECKAAKEAYDAAVAEKEKANQALIDAKQELARGENSRKAAKEALEACKAPEELDFAISCKDKCGIENKEPDKLAECEMACDEEAKKACDKAIYDTLNKEFDEKERECNNKQQQAEAASGKVGNAEKALNDALTQETLACKDMSGPPTMDCMSAQENRKKAQENVDSAKSASEDALKASGECEIELGQIAKDKEDHGKKIREQIAAEKEAKEKAAEEAARAAEEEAKAKRQAEADEICAKYGEESAQCKTAKARVNDPNHRGIAVEIKQGAAEAELGFNYTKSDDADVFEMITRRAAYIIISIKPIVYIFAGFGLIAFAWGAIFNKISWKHFANISIGLFLVANAGRLIEYMVSNGDGNNYYIGQWNDSANKKKENELSAALGDTYYTYSYQDVDLQEQWDKRQEEAKNKQPKKEDNTTTKDKDDKKSADPSDVVEKATEGVTDKDKFCQSGLGLGNGGFKECIKDVVGAVKHVADSVKTTINVVNNVQNQVGNIMEGTEGLKDAFNQLREGDIYGGLHGIVNNIGDINIAFDSAKGSVDSGYDSVKDNVTNIGDSSNIHSNSLLGIFEEGLTSVEGATNSWNNSVNGGGSGGGSSSGGGQ